MLAKANIHSNNMNTINAKAKWLSIQSSSLININLS